MRKKKWLAGLLLLALLCGGVSAQAAEESGGFDPSLFTGKRVGVMSGGIYAQLGPELLEDAEMYYFSTSTDIVAALVAGKLDAMMEDRTSLQYTASQVSGYRVEIIEGTENPIAFIAPKTEEGAALVAELDEWIIGIRSSGELERLEEKWLRGTEEDRVMESYKTLPAVNGTLSVATDPQLPPMEYMKGSDLVVRAKYTNNINPDIATNAESIIKLRMYLIRVFQGDELVAYDLNKMLSMEMEPHDVQTFTFVIGENSLTQPIDLLTDSIGIRIIPTYDIVPNVKN